MKEVTVVNAGALVVFIVLGLTSAISGVILIIRRKEVARYKSSLWQARRLGAPEQSPRAEVVSGVGLVVLGLVLVIQAVVHLSAG